jgi:hypothetical protein
MLTSLKRNFAYHKLLELQSKVEVPQVFDSEIFEWTQRPCSPELRSTPSKKQVYFAT